MPWKPRKPPPEPPKREFTIGFGQVTVTEDQHYIDVGFPSPQYAWDTNKVRFTTGQILGKLHQRGFFTPEESMGNTGLRLFKNRSERALQFARPEDKVKPLPTFEAVCQACEELEKRYPDAEATKKHMRLSALGQRDREAIEEERRELWDLFPLARPYLHIT